MPALDILWSIPPIQDAIASHLDRKDFYRCILVSKLLHQVFIPFLWRQVTVRNEIELLTFTSSEAQARNRQYIKTFALDQRAAQKWVDHLEEQGPLVNLTSLTLIYDYMATALSTMELLEAIAWHSKLEHLKIEFNVCAPGFQNAFPQFMAKMTHLRRLHVVLQRYKTVQDLVVVFGACKNLEELVYSSFDCLDLGANLLGGIEFPMTRIKKLKFHPRRVFGQALLEHFLPSCPQLQRLELVGDTWVPRAAERIASAIRAHCIHLNEICLMYARHLDVKTILVACPRLRRLSVRIPDQDQDGFLSMIIEHHGSSLEHLDISEDVVSMEHLFQITGSCRKMQWLRVLVNWPTGFQQGDVSARDLGKIPWACTSMKVLSLHFVTVEEGTDDSFDEDDDDDDDDDFDDEETLDRSRIGPTVRQPKGWYDRRSVESFFRQVSRLIDLSTLRLGARYDVVGFREAFFQHLGRLSSLKDLQHLYYADLKTSPLLNEERLLMLDQWPRLVSFAGLVDPDLNTVHENALPLIVARRAEQESK